MTPDQKETAEARDGVLDLAAKFGWVSVHDSVVLALPYMLALLAIENDKLEATPQITKLLDSLHKGHMALAAHMKQMVPKTVIQTLVK